MSWKWVLAKRRVKHGYAAGWSSFASRNDETILLRSSSCHATRVSSRVCPSAEAFGVEHRYNVLLCSWQRFSRRIGRDYIINQSWSGNRSTAGIVRDKIRRMIYRIAEKFHRTPGISIFGAGYFSSFSWLTGGAFWGCRVGWWTLGFYKIGVSVCFYFLQIWEVQYIGELISNAISWFIFWPKRVKIFWRMVWKIR